MPLATKFTTCDTEMRRPRIVARPPNTFGSYVMQSNIVPVRYHQSGRLVRWKKSGLPTAARTRWKACSAKPGTTSIWPSGSNISRRTGILDYFLKLVPNRSRLRIHPRRANSFPYLRFTRRASLIYAKPRAPADQSSRNGSNSRRTSGVGKSAPRALAWSRSITVKRRLDDSSDPIRSETNTR